MVTAKVITSKYLRCGSYELPYNNPYQYLDGDLSPQPEALKKDAGLLDRVKCERYEIVFLKRRHALPPFGGARRRLFINRF